MTELTQAPRIVEDLMTADLVVIRPNDQVGWARDLIMTLGIHALPVVDEDAVVGIVTTADLADDWRNDEPVRTVMTVSPLSVGVETSLYEAAELMTERRIHHLMVEEAGDLIGILSSLDLLQVLVIPRAD